MKLQRFLASGRILFEQMAGRPMTEDRRNQESDVFVILRDDSKGDGHLGFRFFIGKQVFTTEEKEVK